MASYRSAGTFLGYMKTQVANGGYSVKYLSRDFLNTFLTDYKRGDGDYTATAQTDFYKRNGCAYCYFLECYAAWRETCARLDAMGFGRA